MTQCDFEHNLHGATSLSRLSDFPDSDYWHGYMRGVRRNYHGEKFGTDKEHALWMTLADETEDDTRRLRGLGYKEGFGGTGIADAIKHLGLVKQGFTV